MVQHEELLLVIAPPGGSVSVLTSQHVSVAKRVCGQLSQIISMRLSQICVCALVTKRMSIELCV
jgi:hypothetical protein